MHAAGQADRPTRLRFLMSPSFQADFAPKAVAGARLHHTAHHTPLCTFLLFSSVAAWYDNVGFAGYSRYTLLWFDPVPF